jgi:hypothetical protein
MKTRLFLMAFAFAANTAYAQSGTVIEAIKVEPAMIKAGETVKVTVTGTEGEIPNCGMKLHFGDGVTQDFKLTKKGMLPLVVEYKYEKAGDFKVMAEPKMVTSHLKCIGKNQNAVVKVAALPAPVAAPVPAPVAAAPVAAAKSASGPSCPEGWKLDTKSVVKKTGAFKCTAPAGTKLPEKKMSCPGDLSYVENSKKGLIACQL